MSAPFGYVVNDKYVNISVDTDTAFETDGDTNDAIITVEYSDAPAVGELTVEKKGEVLDGFKGGLLASSYEKEFVYREGSLAGAKFKVYAAEDIYTADNQKDADGNRIKYYSNGDLVTTLTTGMDGKATAKNLPLGQYRVVEVEAPYGYVLNPNEQKVTFTYVDDKTPVIKESLTFSDDRQKLDMSVTKLDAEDNTPIAGAVFGLYADEDIKNVAGKVIIEKGTLLEKATSDENGKIAFVKDYPFAKYVARELVKPAGYVTNERQKVQITVTKTDSETKEALEGAVFGLFAKEDIVNKDGKVIVKADTQIERTVTGKDGKAAFTSDLPLGQYYVKEIEAPKGYVKSDKIFDVDASYQGDKVKVIEFDAAFENAPIKVEISKTDITGEKELPGAKLSVIDADGKLVESWISEAGKTHMIERLPVGKYTLREESAPYGYKVASDVTFEVKETAEIQKVSMKDEQVVGKIVIEKTDKVTGKLIEGVVFEVRDKDGKVLDILTTDKNGHAESKELPICTYNEDGTFKEDIHYTVVETKAADGYILDETAHDVTLRYDDNAPDVVVTTLKLINVPTEPKLPQTGDNANPLLYLGIGALALITGVGVGLRGRKKKNKQ